MAATLGGYLVLDHDASHSSLPTRVPIKPPREGRERGAGLALQVEEINGRFVGVPKNMAYLS